MGTRYRTGWHVVTRRELLGDLRKCVGESSVVWRPEDLSVYAFDGTIERQLPHAVVVPDTPEEVAATAGSYTGQYLRAALAKKPAAPAKRAVPA